MPSPIIAPMRNATRQANQSGRSLDPSNRAAPPDPITEPSQKAELIPRSTWPRTRAGINSSIAELIAEYSPPIPAPVRNRQGKKNKAFFQEEGRAVGRRY